MNYRSLGRSDLSVSEISFGCMSLGTDQNANTALLLKAYESGINFFDTADLYDKGWNEETVGIALRPVRDNVIIATKVGNQWRKDGSGWDWNPTKKHILKAVEESLRRLKTDYIDLYQLHGGTIEDPIDEAIEAFELLKEQGKIREYGISSIRPNVIREWVKKSKLSSVMMQYSLLDRRPEEESLDLLHEHKISVITRGSLAKGMLVDKAPKDYFGYTAEQVEKLQNAVQKAGNPVGVSLQFVLQHPAVASAVTGIRTNAQLESVISGMKNVVSGLGYNGLTKLVKPNVYELHR
ncbi:MAG: aldo/keto reductase [Balneolaceae bacterium]